MQCSSPDLSATAPDWREFRFTVHDGLSLHARIYEAEGANATPLLCLPGLSRNARDFHVLAQHVAFQSARPRSVYCLDFRGRGGSDYDPSGKTYTPYIELLDTLDFMAAAGLHKVIPVGTSRGGLVTMIMAVARPTAIAAAVLNDIGPVIEVEGLHRIQDYLRTAVPPSTWNDAASIMKGVHGPFFPTKTDEEWCAFAHQIFRDEDGKPVADYDIAVMESLNALDKEGGPPPMWPQYLALSGVPVLVLRGATSDLLSDKTAAEMVSRHPNAHLHVVPEEGHAPLLKDMQTLQAITGFLEQVD